MQNLDIELLNHLFSKARLSSYLSDGDDARQIIVKYNANISLSEAMIPALHYFEILFRNRLDQAIQKYYGSNWLLEQPKELMISDKNKQIITEISGSVRQNHRRICSHDDIVAGMTFGFWCSFLHRKYDPIIWQRKEAVKIIFPNLARIERKRSTLEEKIFKIKDLRNRIAHYESILNLNPILKNYYTSCRGLIEAISNEAPKMLKDIDRFPKVYQSIFGKKF